MKPFSEGRPPYGLCPKCESYSEEWKPQYHETTHSDMWGGQSFPMTPQEHLDWYCSVCGYSVQTATADAKTAVPA